MVLGVSDELIGIPGGSLWVLLSTGGICLIGVTEGGGPYGYWGLWGMSSPISYFRVHSFPQLGGGKILGLFWSPLLGIIFGLSSVYFEVILVPFGPHCS